MMKTDVKSATQKTVQESLNKNEPFTSACISHPIISDDSDVRHFDVSQAIRSMWRGGQMIGEDGSSYVRTSITVWPDGPGTIPANAWLYHSDSFDANSFKPRSRVLVRSGSPDDGDDAVVSLTNTADGSTVQNQCQVQKIDTTLNVPRNIIKKIGWQAGDGLTVDVSGSTVVIKKADSGAKRKVDKEGRIRLHGAAVEALQTTSPIALLVDPNGADNYIQISALTVPSTTSTAPATVDDANVTPDPARGLSVWDN
jgi:bifunctional DNA-binding transcriptional regulator/antitoxin component of YhaV-PrlF toxin-antitoxin module